MSDALRRGASAEEAGALRQHWRRRESYRTSVRPRLAEMLAATGIDIVIERAEGDFVWYRNAAGEEVRVLDLLGGFGSTLFGHNHPTLVARAQALLQSRTAVHAQASVRGYAAELGERLSGMLAQRTGREFVTTLANSGAEAVEAALKHAEMELWARRDAKLRKIRRNVARIKQDAPGRLRFSSGSAALRTLGGASSAKERAVVLDQIVGRAAHVLDRRPIVLAVENAFHGKTTGALRLTHNATYRGPWARAQSATFLPADDGAFLENVIRANTESYDDVDIEIDGTVTITARSIVHVIACIVEPVQGEGGMRPIAAGYLALIRASADRGDFPLIMDEIQSGMGRTGTFLASEAAGVRADYYLLAKALGGGIAKIGALLVDKERYQHDFGYLHTSTFAEDDPSSALALTSLDLLEERNGEVMDLCRRKGEHLLSALRGLVAEYPDILVEVRGRGLMIGVELRAQLQSPSPMIRVLSEQSLLTFLAAGYFLHEAAIRIAPTLSAHRTLRLEPSAYIAVAELDRFVCALRQFCDLMRRAQVARLWQFAFDERPRSELISCQEADAQSHEGYAHSTAPAVKSTVGFLVHFRTGADLRLFDRGFSGYSEEACERYFEKARVVLDPFVVGTRRVWSAAGSLAVDLVAVGLPFTARAASMAMASGIGEPLIDLIRRGMDLARDHGASLVGLGGYTSIITDNCQAVLSDRLGVTSGNSLTVAAAVDAMLGAARRHGFARRTLGIVGATGNIGAMIAEALATEVDALVLVGRPGAIGRLERLAARLGGPTEVTTDLAALTCCNMVVCASNAPRPIVGAEHLGAGPIVVCDVAVPSDVDRRGLGKNVHLLRGGSIRLPNGQRAGFPGLQLASDRVYACMAEAAVLGLSGMDDSFSFGALQSDKIKLIRSLAKHHGFVIDEDVIA